MTARRRQNDGGVRPGIAGAVFLALLLSACTPSAPPLAATTQKPMRIVSMNPCIDAILMEVAAPAQVAAISHYSHDPRATSVSLKWALQYPAVSNAAEDVIAAKPDLVIAGPHVAIQTVAALKRLGVPVMQLPPPETVADSKKQIRDIALRIGQEESGRKLNGRIDAAMMASRADSAAISALIWQGSGLVPGKGTLADELLSHTGFFNISASLGLRQWDILPLEGMLAAPPAVLLTGTADMGESQGEANRILSHPALRKARSKIRVAHYPSSLLNCGGPTIIRAVARLAEVRRLVKGGR